MMPGMPPYGGPPSVPLMMPAMPMPMPAMPVPALIPAIAGPAPALKNERMKTLAIISFITGFLLAIVGSILTVVGIGVCVLPFAFVANVAGFVFLCLI